MDGEWIVPGFRHLRQLGSGATGVVMQGEHIDTATPVAIKYFSAALLVDEEYIYQFREEAAVLAELRDAHCVILHEYDESEYGAAVVTELVDGVSLGQLIASEGPTGSEIALYILRGLLLGLSAAHAAGITHTDVKPANVLVAGDGETKLSDFCVAVRAGDNVPSRGTPAYMPSELWGGRPPTPATDIYSATAVFVECLTGQPPYPGATLPQLAQAHRTAPIPTAGVPEPLRSIVEHGMAKNPYDRPQSAREFLAEVESVALAAYGMNWADYGRGKLAELAALLSMLFPLGQRSATSRMIGPVGSVGGPAALDETVQDPSVASEFADYFADGPAAPLAAPTMVNGFENTGDDYDNPYNAYNSQNAYRNEAYSNEPGPQGGGEQYADDAGYYAGRDAYGDDQQAYPANTPPSGGQDDYGMDWGDDDGDGDRRKKTLVAVGAGVAALVLLGGATAAVYAMSGGGSSPNSAAAPQTSASATGSAPADDQPTGDPTNTPPSQSATPSASASPSATPATTPTKSTAFKATGISVGVSRIGTSKSRLMVTLSAHAKGSGGSITVHVTYSGGSRTVSLSGPGYGTSFTISGFSACQTVTVAATATPGGVNGLSAGTTYCPPKKPTTTPSSTPPSNPPSTPASPGS